MSSYRIISLVPSGTETLYNLGLTRYIVGRSHECDYPPEIENVPVCSKPRHEPVGVNSDIYKNSKSALNKALSIYKVDIDKLKELKPTHIITQTLCKVCTICTEDIEEALKDYLNDNDVQIIDLTALDLEAALNDMIRIGKIFGKYEESGKLVLWMKKRFKRIRQTAKKSVHKPTVALIEWIDPLMPSAHWNLPLVKYSQGKNVFPDASLEKIKFEDLQEKDPKKIIIAPCGLDLEKTEEEFQILKNHPGWNDLKAVRFKEIYLADGSQYFNRPGPRLTETCEILAEIIHPDFFDPRHEGYGWIRVYT